jgi:hypothetical protein
MHLYALNLPESFTSLWRGTMKCDPGDDKSTWDWVVLTGRQERHGAAQLLMRLNIFPDVLINHQETQPKK